MKFVGGGSHGVRIHMFSRDEFFGLARSANTHVFTRGAFGLARSANTHVFTRGAFVLEERGE